MVTILQALLNLNGRLLAREVEKELLDVLDFRRALLKRGTA